MEYICIVDNCSKMNSLSKSLRVCYSDSHHQGSWRYFGSSSGGVRLGLHSAHRGGGQPPSRRPGWALWWAQHWWPHYVGEWHQLGGSAYHYLPKRHSGKKGKQVVQCYIIYLKWKRDKIIVCCSGSIIIHVLPLVLALLGCCRWHCGSIHYWFDSGFGLDLDF